MDDSQKFLFAPNPFQMCHLGPFPIVPMGYHSCPLLSRTYRDFRRLITQRSVVQIHPPQPIQKQPEISRVHPSFDLGVLALCCRLRLGESACTVSHRNYARPSDRMVCWQRNSNRWSMSSLQRCHDIAAVWRPAPRIPSTQSSRRLYDFGGISDASDPPLGSGTMQSCNPRRIANPSHEGRQTNEALCKNVYL